ncbi:hypothetical protein [Dactylosporangium sp. NPDC000521]|uniref:hypothetical protein n=1 Tax=Dactylosporangium sp. NPDC000521 TaxID=3363975 RepID=UPI0036B3A975
MDESETSMAGHEAAQRAADALAVALEEAGFDVGRAFPELRTTVDADGSAHVEIGPITPDVAGQLVALLTDAAGRGVTLDVLGD